MDVNKQAGMKNRREVKGGLGKQGNIVNSKKKKKKGGF